MDKKPKAVYEPGELDRIRQKLGDIDPEEARRLAQKLGGEVGIEKSLVQAERKQKTRNETVELKIGSHSAKQKYPKRIIEPIQQEKKPARHMHRVSKKQLNPEDDPSIPIKTSYRERVKMDRYAAQAEFEIKNTAQVLYSVLSLFGDPPDYINPDFTLYRMNEYYAKIEALVTATRTLLPRNNIQRNELYRKENPFYYTILDTIRYWNIEKISGDLTRIQARPRSTKCIDFSDILKAYYKPVYILEQLDPELHIRESYKVLYKILHHENQKEAKAKYQPLIRKALGSYGFVIKNIKFYLYPLLLKLLSNQWIDYDDFFTERKTRYEHFIGAEPKNILTAPPVTAEPEQTEKKADPMAEEKTTEIKKEPSKALLKGKDTLETLFPKAGWLHPEKFPDMYPYYADIFSLEKGYELIPPIDPMHQIAFLMLVLEELFYGLRYIQFGTITGTDGNPEKADECINRVINGWHDYIERIFEKEYLPRLGEYCRVLDGSSEAQNTNYTKRIQMELFWLKRLYFLPYFRFESVNAPPFRRQDINPLYSEVRSFRRVLTAVAAGIEQSVREGGAEQNVHCNTVDNPWDSYIFQLQNPVSIRIDKLLGIKNSKKKNNAALIFYTLAITTVLDHIMNEEAGWAYGENIRELFRSVDNDGIKPQFGVDTRINTEALFKEYLKNRASNSQ